MDDEVEEMLRVLRTIEATLKEALDLAKLDLRSLEQLVKDSGQTGFPSISPQPDVSHPIRRRLDPDPAHRRNWCERIDQPISSSNFSS